MSTTIKSTGRFSLARLLLWVTLWCVWLSLFSVDVELFVGVGLLVFTMVWIRVRYRKFFRKGVFALHELLSVVFFVAIGFGLVARFVAVYFAV